MFGWTRLFYFYSSIAISITLVSITPRSSFSKSIKFDFLMDEDFYQFQSNLGPIASIRSTPIYSSLFYTDKTKPNGLPLTSYDEVIKLLQDSRAITVEDFLSQVPQKNWESFTLMRKSLSLQGGSPWAPRALIYGPDARLIFSFNGSPQQKGGSEIEFMQSNGENNKIEYFRVSFEKSMKTLNFRDVEVSEKNPSACLKCHSSFPKPNGLVKPIWSRYSFWIDSYGENKDKIDPRTEEGSNYIEWKRNIATSHPRYSYLYQNSNLKSEGNSGRDLETKTNGEKKDDLSFPYFGDSLDTSPNQKLGVLLNIHNSKNIATHIQSHPKYKSLKSMLLYTLICEIPNYEPEFSETHSARSYLQNDPLTPKYLAVASELGVSFDAWTLMFTEQSYFYSPGGGAETPLLVGSYLARTDKDFSSMPGIKFENWKSGSTFYMSDSLASELNSLLLPLRVSDTGCKNLGKQFSKRELVDLYFKHNGIKYGVSTARSLLRTCASCHESNKEGISVAPYIPFGVESDLIFFVSTFDGMFGRGSFTRLAQRKISQDNLPSHAGGKRMPLGRYPLAPHEQEILIEYLEGLNSY